MIESPERQIYIAEAPGVARALGQSDTMRGFELREHNPVQFPEQDPMAWHVAGNRMPIANTDFMADKITEGKYESIIGGLSSAYAVNKIADEVSEHIYGDGKENEGGGNVLLVTPHAEVTDIAFGLKILSDLLEARGNRPDLGILLSKMVPEYNYITADGPVSAIFVLQLLCSDIYMSWPRTDSSKSFLDKLPQSELRRHNQALLQGILKRFQLGKMVLAMAPTGTTQVNEGESGIRELAKFSERTISLMLDPNTKVLPMVANILRGKKSVVRLPSGLITVRDMDDAENLRQYLGSLHA